MSAKGLKIIDASTVLAGPSVATFFAELGAEVIKIEGPKGDVTQSWRLSSEGELGWSAYYSSVNFGKENLSLNLKSSVDYEVFKNLLQSADVLITNFKESDNQKFLLNKEVLLSLNEKLVWGQIKGFENDHERLAYDVVLQAETGFMFMNGQPHSPATKMPVALIDVLAAHQLKEGILWALLERSETSKGGEVSVSLEAAAISALTNQASNYLMTGHIPKRMGSMHPNIAPYGDVFTTADNSEIVLAIGSNQQFNSLCDILQLSNEVKEKFSSNVYRVGHRDVLVKVLQEAFRQSDSTILMNQFHEKRVPAGRIKNLKEVFKTETAQSMVLSQWVDGQNTQRVQQKAFSYSSWYKGE